MSLAERCSKAFTEAIRTQGDQLFQKKLIVLGEMDDEYLDAKTQSEDKDYHYSSLEWFRKNPDTTSVEVRCTCESFVESHLLCAHVWATILIADQNGWDGQLPGYGPVEMIHAYQEQPLEPDPPENSDPVGGMLDMLSSVGNYLGKTDTNNESTPSWKKQFEAVRAFHATKVAHGWRDSLQKSSKQKRVWFLVDLDETQSSSRLTMEFHQQETRKNGDFGKVKGLRISREELDELTDPIDRELCSMVLGNSPEMENQWSGNSGYGPYYTPSKFSKAVIMPSMYSFVLPKLADSGRLGWMDTRKKVHPLKWDDGAAWQVKLTATETEDEHWKIWGYLFRGEERIDLADPILFLYHGLVFFKDKICALDAEDSFGWVSQLYHHGPIPVPKGEAATFLQEIWEMPHPPSIEMPEELECKTLDAKPKPRVCFTTLGPHEGRNLGVDVSFDYGGKVIPWLNFHGAIVDPEKREVVHRDRKAEKAAVESLIEYGVSIPAHPKWQEEYDFTVPASKLPELVRELTPQGWIIEAEGHKIRQAGKVSFSVSSNIDWFEVTTKVDFDGVSASIPELLSALERGEKMIVLGDGSQGMLPEEWLTKFAPLARLGKVTGDKLEFSQSQAALLDALLAAQEDVDVDAKFAEIREKVHSFKGIKPQAQPEPFQGDLREYQREGLGWLHFLQEFTFGGCLADDMGLGKTIQVLALLMQRQLESRNGKRTSLIVVPRSLVHNWIEEAAKFTPNLKVLDYTGPGRISLIDSFPEYDMVITTYGTLRRDIVKLSEFRFDYTILDEAQAIKNADSQAAKASRILNSNFRLALTGTPVENHLGEIWSIFEYLNPGMLGHSSKLQLLSSGTPEDAESLQLLAHALRPFILRRTKEEVLTELPAKTEQTLFCEMDTKQLKQYTDLREHYRVLLSKKIDEQGLNKSKIHVLEALLRLRQVACHPGLVDENLIDAPSAKLEALLQQLDELMQEGHKALVFSQFTSLLAIVKRHLDKQNIPYEYLDGRTRNRKEKIDHFQEDPDCKIFLISLKAGGQGLNLTAADYVFILDPWWNPAVEAQAVDRAHRIGQTRKVFAYRLITRGTVEEKILTLQSEKKKLADAIINADNSLIKKLTAEDLQLLLS